MIPICVDLDGKSQWVYDPDTQKYMRVTPNGQIGSTGNGKLLARLHGRDVPNPDITWQNRCARAGVLPNSSGGTALKPSPVTYALWNHWQGVNNA